MAVSAFAPGTCGGHLWPWLLEELVAAAGVHPGQAHLGSVVGCCPRARSGAASLQMGYLKKLGDGSLLYSVVNAAEPDADGGCLTQV